jgi:hypothetical protein
MQDEARFEVASGRVFREKYVLSAENRPTIRLDPLRVPEKFRPWILLAERWGIGDDLNRESCVQQASSEELLELLTFGDIYDDVLTEWLAGPESKSKKPTEEYVAFTCLGMAWDSARAIVKKPQEESGKPRRAA